MTRSAEEHDAPDRFEPDQPIERESEPREFDGEPITYPTPAAFREARGLRDPKDT